MIKNYLTIAFRIFRRDKAYSLLNLSGLTIGITAAMLLFAYSFNESQYDQHHVNKDRIVRVVMDVNFGDDIRAVAVGPAALGSYLKNHAKGVEEYAILRPISGFQIKKDDNSIAETGLYYASQGVLDMFTYQWLAGDRASALVPHNAMVLSRSLAEKYFGSVDKAVGGVISRDDNAQYLVTGVIENVTQKGHFTPAALVSLWDDSKPTNWKDWNWCAYLLMSAEQEDLQPLLQKAFEENLAPLLEQQGGGKIAFSTQKLTDIYYESRLDFEMEPNEGNRLFIRGFVIVGGFLLLLAIINYINLVTAQSEKRAREVGVKKAFGASTSLLRWQFLTEAMIYVVVSVALSFALLILLSPAFKYFTGDHLPFELLLNWKILLLAFGFIFITGILSGAYPALFLTSFRPVRILKAGALLTTHSGSLSLRKSLIVLQLSVSLLMIVGIAGVYSQLKFVSGYNLGFDKEKVLKFNLPNAAIGNYSPLRETLLANPLIRGVGSAIETPGEKPAVNDFTYDTSEGERTQIIQQMWVDHGFFTTLKIPILVGGDFRRRQPGDSSSSGVLVNRSFVAHAGWTMEEAPGKPIWSHDWNDRVIGVVDDFHVVSLHDKIEPMVFRYSIPCPNMLVRFSGATPEAMEVIQAAVEQVTGERLSSWSFLDQDFQRQYEQDEKRASLLAVFACVVIFIACLGLLGLSSYEVRQRNKEIGIRKILGATSVGIVTLLSRSYLALMAWAAVLSIPVANYLLTEWLQSFAYRIEVSWWIHVLPLVLLTVICFSVVGLQSLKATRINPANCLRHE